MFPSKNDKVFTCKLFVLGVIRVPWPGNQCEQKSTDPKIFRLEGCAGYIWVHIIHTRSQPIQATTEMTRIPFFLLLLTNPRKRTCDVCRTIGGRKHRNSQQHGCNFERHQPNNTGYGALDSEMKRCSYERRMVKRLR